MLSEERLYLIPNLEKGICQFLIPGLRKCLINSGSKDVTVIQSQSLIIIARVFSEQPHWRVRMYLVREYISMASALTSYQCILSVLINVHVLRSTLRNSEINKWFAGR